MRVPTLTPDAALFRPVALLKESRHGSVSLVQSRDASDTVVARWIRPIPGVDLSQAVVTAARELKSLDHPGLPRFRDVLEAPSGFWFLFDYIEGYPLSAYDGVQVAPAWGLQWLGELLSILDYLHTRPVRWPLGVIDPTDVVVSANGLVLVDMGLMERLLPETAALARAALHSPYMAPETRLLTTLPPEADLYSAGAIATWLLTGQPPIVNTRWHPGPPGVLDRLLNKDPVCRLSASHVRQILQPYLMPMQDESPPLPPCYEGPKLFARSTRALMEKAAPRPLVKAEPAPPEPQPSSRRRTPRWLGAVAALALLVMTMVAVRTARPPPYGVLQGSIEVSPITALPPVWKTVSGLDDTPRLVQTTAQPAIVELPSGRLSIASSTQFSFSQQGQTFNLGLRRGQLRLVLPANYSAQLHVDPARWLDAAPGTELVAGTHSAGCLIHIARGHARINAGAAFDLSAGRTIVLPPVPHPDGRFEALAGLPDGWP